MGFLLGHAASGALTRPESGVEGRARLRCAVMLGGGTDTDRCHRPCLGRRAPNQAGPTTERYADQPDLHTPADAPTVTEPTQSSGSASVLRLVVRADRLGGTPESSHKYALELTRRRRGSAATGALCVFAGWVSCRWAARKGAGRVAGHEFLPGSSRWPASRRAPAGP